MYSADRDGRVTWYLVFSDSDADGWWKWFCRKGFEHVMLFAQHGDNVICLDPTTQRLNIRLAYNCSAEATAHQFASEMGKTVLRVTHEQKPKIFPPVCMYCVTVAKYALGIPAWAGITPYGLFRYLISHTDATVVDFTEHAVSA